MHAEGRGGAAYALWLSGHPAIVVDMGGDTPTALARAGVRSGSVDVVLVSHLHADHISGLADFLWGEVTAERQRALAVAGPDSADRLYPTISQFLQRLVGEDGAFPAMRGVYAGDPFAVNVTTVLTSEPNRQQVMEYEDVVVTALPVPHGQAPALAYRLDAPQFSIVFGGDQSGLNPAFAEFASDADVLILHAIVTDRAKDDRLANVVGFPARFGALARDSRAKRVVLGHLMGHEGSSSRASLWSLSDIQSVVSSFRREYQGPVMLASDSGCLQL